MLLWRYGLYLFLGRFCLMLVRVFAVVYFHCVFLSFSGWPIWKSGSNLQKGYIIVSEIEGILVLVCCRDCAISTCQCLEIVLRQVSCLYVFLRKWHYICMDAFWFIRLIKENSAVAFNNLASDLTSYLHVNGKQCEAHSSSLSALLWSATISVGP